jgi:hypothetical protein
MIEIGPTASIWRLVDTWGALSSSSFKLDTNLVRNFAGLGSDSDSGWTSNERLLWGMEPWLCSPVTHEVDGKGKVVPVL